MDLSAEQINKARLAKSPHALLALAGAEGVPMTREEARDCFAKLHPPAGELSDEELENVNAGMADAGPAWDDYGTAESSLNAEIIAKGKHSTMVLTCHYCGHLGVMDRYAYTYTYDGMYGPSVITDRIQVCRNCKKVNRWEKSGGC